MIANARMYSVESETYRLWRALFTAVFGAAELPVTLVDHAAPSPLEALWERPDQGAVFMCGLPFSRAPLQPVLVAAPVPALARAGAAQYWSHWVVRKEGAINTVADAFGGRLALTVPGSQSGCAAALSFFMSGRHAPPLFAEITAPTVTPLGALHAVIRGEADIAPIDSYAFSLMERYRADLAAQVRIVGNTCPTPIPPLVASADALEPPRLHALRSAFLSAHRRAPTRDLMARLLLRRFELPTSGAYDVLRERFDIATAHWAVHRLAERLHPAFKLIIGDGSLGPGAV